MSPKKKRVLQIVCVAIVVLGVVGFSLRGWIRGTLGLTYVRSLHLESFSMQFEENLTDLNAILKPYHLDMAVYSPPEFSGPRWGVGGMLSGVAGQDMLLTYKRGGKPECTLTLYGQLETNKKYQLASSLACERRVYLFGGYTHDH